MTKSRKERTRGPAGARARGRLRAGATLLATATLLGLGRPLAAQEDAAAGSMACWRGQPRPSCGGFFLVEMQGVFPLAQPERRPYSAWAGVFESRLEWNLGYMVNVSDRWAVGGLVAVGTGGTDPLTGLRARARRWLGPELSLELESGLLRTRADFGSDVSGLTLGARLNVADKGSLFVRWDGVDVPPFAEPWAPYPNPGGFKHALSVGVGTGSTWAVATSGALGAAYLVALLVFLSSYD